MKRSQATSLRQRTRPIIRLIWVVALLLTIDAWYSSHQRFESLEYRTERFRVEDEWERSVSFTSTRGAFFIAYISGWTNHAELYRKVIAGNLHERNESGWRHAAFLYGQSAPPWLPYIGDLENSGFTLRSKSTDVTRSGIVTRNIVVGAPYWAITLALVLPVAILLVLRARRNRLTNMRISLGQCIACGYDLRASPGRCPECGMETAA